MKLKDHISIALTCLIAIVFFSFCGNHKKPVNRIDFKPEEVLHLDITPEALQVISASRDKALQLGILMTSDSDWQKAIITLNGKECKADIRLKGDWTDHLKGDKWSFRVNLKGENSIYGLNSFSLQDPLTRDYLTEYVFHEWLKEEDVLTTYYDFVPFSFNQQLKGVYAIEGHFDKNLIESQRRREGPIVRFSEESMWESRVIDINKKQETGVREKALPTFETAAILPFKPEQLAKSEAMKNQFAAANTLMFQFQNGSKKLEEIFDLDKTAKYYAIIDITKAYHGLIWHNQRFYFNPVIQKLEPIGFDGFTEDGAFDYVMRPFVGYAQNPDFKARTGGDLEQNIFFGNPHFVELYAKYLLAFSNEKYQQALMARLEPSIAKREKLIRNNKPDYTFNRNLFLNNAKAISSALIPEGDNAVKVYTEKVDYGKIGFSAFNNYCLPVKLIGISLRKDAIEYYFDKPITLPAYNETLPPSMTQQYVKGFGNYLFYKIPGMDSLMVVQMYDWKSPAPLSPQQELFSEKEISTSDFYLVNATDVIFKPGKHIISSMLTIPAGYRVYIHAGTSLDFIHHAGFISKSPVFAVGSDDAPVHIYSSDSSAMGFTVLQANEKSLFTNVIFENLNTLNYKGWLLTGAVNFYESKIDFTNCSFLHSHCEDAVNVIRTQANLKFCHIAFTYGDGFDADFSQGVIESSYASNTANDAFDVSGSVYTISNCEMDNIGDKCLSAGEQSTVGIKNCKLSNSPNGVVAKDLSKVTAENISLKNMGNGFSAYVKKSVYGPSEITVKSFIAENVKQLSNALDGSVINLPLAYTMESKKP